tara:strand:- start:1588 stop:1704 length:117 start_codon:yes stop_codon:yes gene_type:complete
MKTKKVVLKKGKPAKQISNSNKVAVAGGGQSLKKYKRA